MLTCLRENLPDMDIRYGIDLFPDPQPGERTLKVGIAYYKVTRYGDYTPYPPATASVSLDTAADLSWQPRIQFMPILGDITGVIEWAVYALAFVPQEAAIACEQVCALIPEAYNYSRQKIF